jgi:leader peptidase (prepilin peptidase) / N-methyltransferase
MWLSAVGAGLFGAAVGSFLNVVIYRMPRGESVVRPGSRCPACGEPIKARDNVPVLSWILLRGKCRNCGARISARYAVVEALNVEALNAGLWIAAALRFEDIEAAAFVALVSSVLLALTMIDLEHRRLPNAIVLPAVAAAVAWVLLRAAVSGEWEVLTTALLCGAAAFSLLFVIAVVSRGMGFGDVKLAAFIGVATGRFGWEEAVAAVLLSFFAGGLVAVVLLVSRRRGRKEAMPFGPALAVGAVLAIFIGPAPVRAWLGL